MEASPRVGCVAMLVVGLILAGNAAAQVCFTETFTFPDSPLESYSGWTLAAGASGRINVLSNEANLVFDSGVVPASTVQSPGLGCVKCGADGTVTVTLKIKRDSTSTGTGNTWNLTFNAPKGTGTIEVARWYGTPYTFRARLGSQFPPGNTAINMTPDQWDELKAVVDMNNRRTTYYYTLFGQTEVMDGTGPLPWPTGLGIPTGTDTITGITLTNNNVAGFTGTLKFDDMAIVRCPGSCFMDVDPTATEHIMGKTSVAAVGGTVYAPTHVWTVTNSSQVAAINWTAAEADAAGNTAAVDYPWLSLFPTSGGPLAPAGTADVTATWSSGSLVAGIYAGNIKYDDDCDSNPGTYLLRTAQLVVGSSPWFVDAFQYPGGDLDAHGGWFGGPGGVTVASDPDNASNQVVKVIMDPNAAAGDVTSAIIAAEGGSCENGIITVLAKIKASPTGSGGKGWSLSFDDAGGKNLATWEGAYNSARGRNASANLMTPYATVTSTQWHELRAEIDVRNNVTTYKFDGVALGAVNPQTHGVDLGSFQAGVGDAIASITITRVENGPLTGYVLFDDIQTIGCPGECMGDVRWGTNAGVPAGTLLPWAPDPNQATVPTDKEYKFINGGLVDGMTYTASEVTAAGATTDYSWMTLSKGGGGPLAAGVVDTPVDVAFNTTGLARGAHLGYVKFTDSCGNPSEPSFMRAIKLNVGDCLAESFDDYANGSLVNSPGWDDPAGTPLGVASPIDVNGGVLRIMGNTLSPAAGTISVTAQHQSIDNCPVCPTDGLIRISIRIRGHVGGSELWEIHFTPLGATDLAAWHGSASQVIARAEVDGDGTSQNLTGGGTWDTLEARINPHLVELEGVPARSTRYYFNGVVTDTLVHTSPPADPPTFGEPRVRRVRVVRFGNDTAADADPMVEIDSLILSACGPVCGSPAFDTNRDGEVDQNDLQTLTHNGLIDCATGPSPGAAVFDALSFQCKCLDINGDKAIDMQEFATFQRCVSSGTPLPDADPNCVN